MNSQKQIFNHNFIYAESAIETARLLAAGADVNAKDKFGRTALTLAKKPEQKELLLNAMQSVRTETKATLEQKPKNTLIKSIAMKNSQKLR